MNIRIKNIVFLGIAALSLAAGSLKAELTAEQVKAWGILMGKQQGNLAELSLDAIKAIITIKDRTTGNTPLHIAASKGNATLYNKLVSYGADETITNNADATAQDLLDLAKLEKEETGSITPLPSSSSTPAFKTRAASPVIQRASHSDPTLGSSDLFRSTSHQFQAGLAADIRKYAPQEAGLTQNQKITAAALIALAVVAGYFGYTSFVA